MEKKPGRADVCRPISSVIAWGLLKPKVNRYNIADRGGDGKDGCHDKSDERLGKKIKHLDEDLLP